MMVLPTSVYSANHGYAWSHIPEGLSEAILNDFCRDISKCRGDFPDPMRIEVGVVSDGSIAGAFTLQNADKWDSAGRASDYFAFAFFPLNLARQIDFIQLINNDFFWMPSHTPPTSLTYSGPESQEYPLALALQLKLKQKATLGNPNALCALLGDYGAASDRWICRMHEGNILGIKCNPWNDQKEQVR